MRTEKAEKLYISITNIKDEIIAEEQMVNPNRKQPMWLKWGAIAACFALILTVSIPLVSNLITRDDKETVQPLNVISFNDAYYEMIDFKNTNTLNRYNLPKQIDSSMIGNRVGTAKQEKDGSLVFLYEYIPENNTIGLGQSIFISKANNSNEYLFALFCNFTDTNADLHHVQDLLNVYAIYNSADISSISIFETGDFIDVNKKNLKSTISDAAKIRAFYDELLISTSVGFDGFQTVEQDDLEWITLKIESTSGAIAYFRYCPGIQYVNWALNYYKVPGTFDAWMD